jgi:hypothetical protein
MVLNITADNIHAYNLTIRCQALTHEAKHVSIWSPWQVYTHFTYIAGRSNSDTILNVIFIAKESYTSIFRDRPFNLKGVMVFFFSPCNVCKMWINLPWGSNTDTPKGSALHCIVHCNWDTDIHLHSKCSITTRKQRGEIRDMVCHSILCLIVMFFFFSLRNFFSDNTRVRILFFSQNLTLGYMTKTLNQIIFFSSTKIRILFSATGWKKNNLIQSFCHIT